MKTREKKHCTSKSGRGGGGCLPWECGEKDQKTTPPHQTGRATWGVTKSPRGPGGVGHVTWGGGFERKTVPKNKGSKGEHIMGFQT